MRTICGPLAALTTLALGACAGAAGLEPAGSPAHHEAAALSPDAEPRAHLCHRIGTFAPLVSEVLALAMPHRAHRAGLHAALSILEEYRLSDCTPLALPPEPLTDPVPTEAPVLPAEPQPEEPQPDPAAESPPVETPAEGPQPEPQPEEPEQPEPQPEEPQPQPQVPEPQPEPPAPPSEPADTSSTPPTVSPQERAQ
jgi:hypothetical protein